jgi:hypothetical protein
MNKAGKRLVIAASVVVILIVLSVINLFVYPFKSSQPNFADVERVFNKIMIPADWVEISSSENRGIAGRACPIEPGTACFHKGTRFTVPSSIPVETIQEVYSSSGCPAVAFKRSEPIGGDPYTNYTCSVEGLEVSGTLIEQESGWELSVYVGT